MPVVDASALVELLVVHASEPGLEIRVYLDTDDEPLHAPHLVDAEFMSATRNLARSRRIRTRLFREILRDYRDLGIDRYVHEPFLERVWELRHTINSYDAFYVALAEALECPLVTCDAVLARAAEPFVRVDCFTD